LLNISNIAYRKTHKSSESFTDSTHQFFSKVFFFKLFSKVIVPTFFFKSHFSQLFFKSHFSQLFSKVIFPKGLKSLGKT